MIRGTEYIEEFIEEIFDLLSIKIDKWEQSKSGSIYVMFWVENNLIRLRVSDHQNGCSRSISDIEVICEYNHGGTYNIYESFGVEHVPYERVEYFFKRVLKLAISKYIKAIYYDQSN